MYYENLVHDITEKVKTRLHDNLLLKKGCVVTYNT